MRGLVQTGLDLSSEDQRLLKSLGHVDNNFKIIELNKEPQGGFGAILLVLGLAGTGGGVGVFVLGRKKKTPPMPQLPPRGNFGPPPGPGMPQGPGMPHGPGPGPQAGPRPATRGPQPMQGGPRPPQAGPRPAPGAQRPPQPGPRPAPGAARPPQAGPRPPQPRPPHAH
ncbi:MAG: hypothetical protein M5U25_14290 [Planctomycetota bacterium]|nr:hypothetical protein [Planctomycetota bacterium]